MPYIPEIKLYKVVDGTETDITPMLRGKSKIRLGSSLRENGVGVNTSSGVINIDNGIGVSNFDSSPQQVTYLNQIESDKEYTIRVKTDGHLCYEGRMGDFSESPDGIDTLFKGKVKSKSYDLLTKSDQLVDLEDNTVAGVCNYISNMIGVTLTTTSMQKTGRIQIKKPWLTVMQQISNYAGGCFFECPDGAFKFVNFFDAQTITPRGSLDLRYGPVKEGLTTQTGESWIRNKAVCNAFKSESSPTDTEIASKTIRMISGETLKFEVRAAKRVKSWTGTFTISDTTNFSLTTGVSPVKIDDQAYEVSITAGTFTGEKDCTVTGTGKFEELVPVTPITLEQSSISDSERPYRIPPFFNENYDGIVEYTDAWMKWLNTETTVIRIKYPLIQASSDLTDTVRQIQPGDVYNLTNLEQNVTSSNNVYSLNVAEAVHKCLITSVEIDFGPGGAPYKTVEAVKLKTVTMPKIQYEFLNNQRTSTQLFVKVYKPVSTDKLYYRYKAKSDTNWGSITTVNTVHELNYFDITGLVQDTEYQYQVSTTNTFTDTTTVDENNNSEPGVNTFLKTFAVNGVQLTGLNYKTGTTFSAVITFPDPSGDLAFTATTDDSGATVTVPATQTGKHNGDTYAATVVVSKDGVSRTYTFNLTVNAPTQPDLIVTGNHYETEMCFWNDKILMMEFVYGGWSNGPFYNNDAISVYEEDDYSFDLDLDITSTWNRRGLHRLTSNSNDIYISNHRSGLNGNSIRCYTIDTSDDTISLDSDKLVDTSSVSTLWFSDLTNDGTKGYASRHNNSLMQWTMGDSPSMTSFKTLTELQTLVGVKGTKRPRHIAGIDFTQSDYWYMVIAFTVVGSGVIDYYLYRTDTSFANPTDLGELGSSFRTDYNSNTGNGYASYPVNVNEVDGEKYIYISRSTKAFVYSLTGTRLN